MTLQQEKLEILYDRLNVLKEAFRNELITEQYFMERWNIINNQIDSVEEEMEELV